MALVHPGDRRTSLHKNRALSRRPFPARLEIEFATIGSLISPSHKSRPAVEFAKSPVYQMKRWLGRIPALTAAS